MPNARLRQIYLAIMQTRAMAGTASARRGEPGTLGLEACLVSPTIDLGPGDMISDVLGGRAIEFLRTTPAAAKSNRKLSADCGAAARLPGKPATSERVWTAVGAAAALQSLAATAKPEETAQAQPGVVVLYLLQDELPAALLRKVLTFAREQKLPLLLILLPPSRVNAHAASPHHAAKCSDLALRCGVPAIPTDARDAVALYRVAQESIGHARIGGGPALIVCIPCILPAGKARRAAPADALTTLEQYMLPRHVITPGWITRETKKFAKRLANQEAASK